MDFRQRLEQAKTRPVNSEAGVEPEAHFACEYFATDRTKSPVCLDLHLPGGIRKAIPYALFTEITMNVETGIEILTSVKQITITGRNLTRLFDYLVTYRVRYIKANIGGDPQEDGLFVDEIEIEDIT